MIRLIHHCGIVLTLATYLASGPGALAADVTAGEDPETRLASWTWQHQGVSVQLVQRLPDQTRAFFLGRGFGTEAVERVAQSCVFQTIFRNDGKEPVEYDLGDWSVRRGAGQAPLLTRETWDRQWQDFGIAQPPRIAFRWALLPTVQRFEPGDYNWGMTSFGLLPGEGFDLVLKLTIGGNPVTGEIQSIQCASDL